MKLQVIIVLICLAFSQIIAAPTQQTPQIKVAQRWPNTTIPYVIGDEYTPRQREAVMAAINDFHSYTCLRFVPRTNEVAYILYSSYQDENEDLCISGLGYGGSVRTIYMSPICREDKPVVIHETMHGLGFNHEHVRMDRDDYITVVWENINKTEYYIFFQNSTLPTPDLGVPYDYASIMHYSADASSINGEPTLIPKKPTNVKLGAAKGLSELDILKVNKWYECKEHLNREKPKPTPSTRHGVSTTPKSPPKSEIELSPPKTHSPIPTTSRNADPLKPTRVDVNRAIVYPEGTIFLLNVGSVLNYEFPSNCYILYVSDITLNEVGYVAPDSNVPVVIRVPPIEMFQYATPWHGLALKNRLVSPIRICFPTLHGCYDAVHLM